MLIFRPIVKSSGFDTFDVRFMFLLSPTSSKIHSFECEACITHQAWAVETLAQECPVLSSALRINFGGDAECEGCIEYVNLSSHREVFGLLYV